MIIEDEFEEDDLDLEGELLEDEDEDVEDAEDEESEDEGSDDEESEDEEEADKDGEDDSELEKKPEPNWIASNRRDAKTLAKLRPHLDPVQPVFREVSAIGQAALARDGKGIRENIRAISTKADDAYAAEVLEEGAAGHLGRKLGLPAEVVQARLAFDPKTVKLSDKLKASIEEVLDEDEAKEVTAAFTAIERLAAENKALLEAYKGSEKRAGDTIGQMRLETLQETVFTTFDSLLKDIPEFQITKKMTPDERRAVAKARTRFRSDVFDAIDADKEGAFITGRLRDAVVDNEKGERRAWSARFRDVVAKTIEAELGRGSGKAKKGKAAVPPREAKPGVPVRKAPPVVTGGQRVTPGGTSGGKLKRDRFGGLQGSEKAVLADQVRRIEAGMRRGRG